MNKNNKKITKKVRSSNSNPLSFAVSGGTTKRGSRVENGSDTFVSTVSGSVNFASQGFQINPGLDLRNLSLSKEAQRYDQYEFLDLSFEFVRSKAVTTTPGMAGMAVDPNPNSADPKSLNLFNAYEISESKSVYSLNHLRVPRDVLKGWRYVRCGPVGTDLSLYDVGRFVFATQDEADGSKIGYVIVHYRVRFRNFHLEPSLPVPHCTTILSHNALQSFTSTITDKVKFDQVVIDGLDIFPEIVDNEIITLPCGQYYAEAEFSARDSVVELFEALITFNFNQATAPYPAPSRCQVNGGEYCYVRTMSYFVSDGTDSINVACILTGPTGTLTIPADLARIRITALT